MLLLEGILPGSTQGVEGCTAILPGADWWVHQSRSADDAELKASETRMPALVAQEGIQVLVINVAALSALSIMTMRTQRVRWLYSSFTTMVLR